MERAGAETMLNWDRERFKEAVSKETGSSRWPEGCSSTDL